MAEYVTGYVVFGILFLLGVVGYWVVTRAFRNPAEIYEPISLEPIA